MLSLQWEVSLTDIPPAIVEAVKTTVDNCNALGPVNELMRAETAYRSIADRVRELRCSVSRTSCLVTVLHKRTLVATLRADPAQT